MTVDSAFLIRVHAQLQAETHGCDDASEILPDLSKHVAHINKYIDLMNEANDDEERLNYEFIVGQLLLITLYQDFSDEVGRRRMFECVRTILSQTDLPFASVRTVIKILSKLSLNSQDFVRVIIEILYAIADPEEAIELDAIYKMRKCLEIIRCALEVVDTVSTLLLGLRVPSKD